jgi:hypothetical protein
MRSWRDRFLAQASLLASILVMLATVAYPGAASAQARLGPIGPHTVGSKLSDVRAYRTVEDCLIEQNGADCTFIAPDGVEYVVLGDSVTAVVAKEKSVHGDLTLPFGLKFGDSLATAVPKLIAQGRRWTVSIPEEGQRGGIVMSSEDIYPGAGGLSFGVDIYFDHDRLVRVDYDSGDGD